MFFCVVPFTRGRERSRDPQTIIQECTELYNNGYREVTLLGQNVDSYRWNMTSKGEIKEASLPTTNFAHLLEMVALIHPDLRIRFSTSHPKDMTDEVIHTMAKYKNICKHIHLPIQSGNNDVLYKMNRGYTVEWYHDRIHAIRSILPNCSISTDIITGFCGETAEQHQDTIKAMKTIKFDFAYMYMYSERPKTLAERKFEDDVPEATKKKDCKKLLNYKTLIHLNSIKTKLDKFKKFLSMDFQNVLQNTKVEEIPVIQKLFSLKQGYQSVLMLQLKLQIVRLQL